MNSNCRVLHGTQGFTLVELMIIVAIVALLAAVATPAYVNHVNRARQTEAVRALMTVKLDQEVFFADHLRYASTIGCLQSFANTQCWNNCAACTRVSYFTDLDAAKRYEVKIIGQSSADNFLARATRTITYANTVDRISITAAQDHAVVERPDALGFSLFKWLFD